MGKALAAYRYGDPADVVDRIRAEEAARAKRKFERAVAPVSGRRASTAGLTQDELDLIPEDWLKR